MSYKKVPGDGYKKIPFSWREKFGNYGQRFYNTNKFGYNPNVTTSFEDIWSPGGSLSFLSSADVMDVVSDSTDDTSAGTGAQQIRLFGLDGSYNVITEDVTLNGTTPVTTTQSFIRVYRAFTIATGSGDVNAGTITISDNTLASTQAQIDADEGQTLMAIYSVRDGYYGLITGLFFSVGGADSAEVEIQTRSPSKGWRVRHKVNLGTGGNIALQFGEECSPILIDPKSDVKVRAKKTGAGGTTTVAASFIIHEIKQEEINI